MRVIDLSQTLEDGMLVYPGDPPVRISQVHTLEKQGWQLRVLSMGSHAGTHVDAPSHMDASGHTIDRVPLARFMGKARVVESSAQTFRGHIGLVFQEGVIDLPLFTAIADAHPLFVVTGDSASLTIEMERKLLQHDILTFTDLINLSQLPEDQEFLFYGIPLKIKDGDGSPVRAFAVVDGLL